MLMKHIRLVTIPLTFIIKADSKEALDRAMGNVDNGMDEMKEEWTTVTDDGSKLKFTGINHKNWIITDTESI